MDEIDRYVGSAGKEGSPISLATARTITFRINRKVVEMSTPTIKGGSAIEREYITGTQEEWHTECPHCGEFGFIRFADICFDKKDTEDFGEKGFQVANVRWRCPACKGESNEHTIKRSSAKWVAGNPEAIQNGVRSFRINAFMSPWMRWKDIVMDFLNAKDDPELLKAFYNTVLGELWEMRTSNTKPEKLHNQREYYNAEVPTGVLLLTMAIDVQLNRLEYEVCGWGREEESWGVSRGIIPGRADTAEVWEEVLRLLDREWTLKNGKALRILATFVDSGYHTDDVYAACGKLAHRRVWAVKGEAGEGREYVRMMKTSKGKTGAIRFMIGVDSGKEAIMHAAAVTQDAAEPGPRYMHYPMDRRAGYDMEYFRGLLSESMVIARKGAKNVISWVKNYERNEPLDLRNYNRAAYWYFNWDFDKLEATIYDKKPDRPRPETVAATEAMAPEKPPSKSGVRVVSKGIRV